MAKRRMFLAELLESDDFCTLPKQAQILYVHLNLSADDDGLLGKPQAIARFLGISKTNLDVLIERGYVISFDSGVIAITHWLLHNKIRRDRYTETRFVKEISSLRIVDKIYKKKEECKEGEGISAFFGNQAVPQCSKEEESLNQSSTDVGRSYLGCSGKGSADISTPECGKPESDENTDKEKTLSEYRRSLLGDDIVVYLKFLRELKILFMEINAADEYEGFVEYNEKRFWKGIEDESVIRNYEPYVLDWLKNRKTNSSEK